MKMLSPSHPSSKSPSPSVNICHRVTKSSGSPDKKFLPATPRRRLSRTISRETPSLQDLSRTISSEMPGLQDMSRTISRELPGLQEMSGLQDLSRTIPREMPDLQEMPCLQDISRTNPRETSGLQDLSRTNPRETSGLQDLSRTNPREDLSRRISREAPSVRENNCHQSEHQFLKVKERPCQTSDNSIKLNKQIYQDDEFSKLDNLIRQINDEKISYANDTSSQDDNCEHYVQKGIGNKNIKDSLTLFHPPTAFSKLARDQEEVLRQLPRDQDPSSVVEVLRQMVETECQAPDSGVDCVYPDCGGHKRLETLNYWVKTLLVQNTQLVDVAAKLEKESKERVGLLETKLAKTTGSLSRLAGINGLGDPQDGDCNDDDISEEGVESVESIESINAKLVKDKEKLEDKIQALEREIQDYLEETDKLLSSNDELARVVDNLKADNMAQEEILHTLTDKNNNMTEINASLLQENEALDAENRNLKDYTENLRNDIDNLLKLSCRARDTGVWDPHGLDFCEVTFEQVCGSMEAPVSPNVINKCVPATQHVTPSPRRGSASSHETRCDSRSSLGSELSLAARRESGMSMREDDVSASLRSASSGANAKIKDLRHQVLALQKKREESVKEAVAKDRVVVDLETQITALNQEMDILKEENNANLTVIHQLKENLHETKCRLSILEDESRDASLEFAKYLSTVSLPEPTQSKPTYTSRFARSMLRRSNEHEEKDTFEQLHKQLEQTQHLNTELQQELDKLTLQVSTTEAEKLQLENQLLHVKTELYQLGQEHDHLKEDFRLLVRNSDEKSRRSAMKTSVSDQNLNLSKAKLIHDAERSKEMAVAAEMEADEVRTELEKMKMRLGHREQQVVVLKTRCEGLEAEMVVQQRQSNVLLADDREIGDRRSALIDLQQRLKEKENEVLLQNIKIQQLEQALESTSQTDIKEDATSQTDIKEDTTSQSDIKGEERSGKKVRLGSFMMSSQDVIDI